MLKSIRLNKAINIFTFLAAGGIAAASNIISRILFSQFLPYSLSIFFAYWVGVIIAFVLFKSVVFQRGNLFQSFPRFIVVNIAMLLLTIAVSNVAYQFLDYISYKGYFFNNNYLLAHMIGVSSPFLPSYFLHKYYTFEN